MAALPDWLDPLYDAAEMRACDAWAIEEQAVASLDLMEAASAGLARVTARLARGGLPIRVLVGPGNNGGDGLAAARLLRAEGREVDVIAAAPLDRLRGDARANLQRLPGAPPEPLDGAGALEGSGAVVDALLGTGFAGEPREPIAGAIAAIAAARADGAPVVACDVPSGVDASTGEVAAAAVVADATATFHGAKIGLHVAPGAAHAGAVEVVPIGIPRGAPAPALAGLISARVLGLYPHRQRFASKFDSGVVVVAGGSRGLTGAPALAALGAARAGAGYVQVAVPASAQPALALRLVEQMPHGLPEDDGAHAPAGVEALLGLAARAGAVVLGPGLGRSAAAVAFARAAAASVGCPLLLDADGLNAHAGRLEALRARRAPTVLTPHAAELGRLLGRPTAAVDAHRLAAVREAAERSGAVVLLKGDDTLVAAPGGPVAVNPGATPALATAGTGDVLSGTIGALLAKRLDPFAAAALGAHAHGRAGRAAAARIGADHVVAGDVVDCLPRGFRAPAGGARASR
ncbi:MAG: NAD(P)H-hydrate dehydratase [Solirubrobacterales bacterium]|nr:NAD(P)H-hydrate dehydratase [Solirubrobacterales bacterium]